MPLHLGAELRGLQALGPADGEAWELGCPGRPGLSPGLSQFGSCPCSLSILSPVGTAVFWAMETVHFSSFVVLSVCHARRCGRVGRQLVLLAARVLALCVLGGVPGHGHAGQGLRLLGVRP